MSVLRRFANGETNYGGNRGELIGIFALYAAIGVGMGFLIYFPASLGFLP